jgi:uracil-DNA glycosylase family 4
LIRNEFKTAYCSENGTGGACSEALFDYDCTHCDRLVGYLCRIRGERPGYYAHPVPSFGPENARLLVVGLAPGMHGANRTGRPFTGDHAGILLYGALHRFGFASHPGSADPGDGLQLVDCRVTNAVKCVPPDNKPLPAEVRQCNGYLRAELERVRPRVALALGRVAHQAVLMAVRGQPASFPFAHAAWHTVAGMRLVDSYHCSRYNTQTGRLTEEMFLSVMEDIRQFLDGGR